MPESGERKPNNNKKLSTVETGFAREVSSSAKRFINAAAKKINAQINNFVEVIQSPTTNE